MQGEPVEVVRYAVDKAKLGRNAYANYYQYQAMLAYLQHLAEAGQDYNVVFMDMDILVVGALDELFNQVRQRCLCLQHSDLLSRSVLRILSFLNATWLQRKLDVQCLSCACRRHLTTL